MQAYSNPKRESDPHALPDVEVFYMHSGPRKAYDRIYVMDRCDSEDSHFQECDECPESGWYWWSCFPGYLPDSEPFGPFATETEALADAQDWEE